jgi:hypothetical protein
MEYLIECNSNSKYGEITHDRGWNIAATSYNYQHICRTRVN